MITSPTTAPISVDDLLGRLRAPRRTGEGRWTAQCPAHGDRGPSLSIREGDDGRVLLHCFAGCTVDEITAALGIEVRQLFPPSDTPWRPTRPRHDPDRAARAMFERLARLHAPVPPERYRRELAFVGAILAQGTAVFAEVADFQAERLHSHDLRILFYAAQTLARQGTPRRWFSPVAVAREVDHVAGREGYAREIGLYRLARLAVVVWRRHTPSRIKPEHSNDA